MTPFGDSPSDEKHQAPGAEEQELESVIEAEEGEEIEPSGPALFDQGDADYCGGEVGDADEHGRHAPLQSAVGTKPVQKKVRWREALERKEIRQDECSPLTAHFYCY